LIATDTYRRGKGGRDIRSVTWPSELMESIRRSQSGTQEEDAGFDLFVCDNYRHKERIMERGRELQSGTQAEKLI
jgi:hypothetical protein